MKDCPQVTVIVPVYNGEKFIAECIDSILSQNFGSLEIVIVDDGSNDRTSEILAEYNTLHASLKVFHQENRGLSTARNKGIELSHGQRLVFVDADDILLPDAIKQMSSAINETDADICQGKITRKPPELYIKNNDVRKRPYRIRSITSETAILEMFYQHPEKLIGGVCGKMYDRQLFDDLKFIEGMAFEDMAILPLLYHSARKIINIDKTVYYYRENPDSFLNKWSPARLDIFKAIDSLKGRDFISDDKAIVKALHDRELSAAFNSLILLDKYSVDNPYKKEKLISVIKNRRVETLLNSKSRLKNRLGAAISYFGLKGLYRINRILKIVR